MAAVRLGSHHDDASPPPTGSVSASPSAPTVTLPPKHVQWDYQIGGAYPLTAGARVVSRDHDSEPAPGVYNICNINAFQAQKGEERDWDSDLLLRDAKADVVYDKDWGEAVLDIRTAAKRQRIAARLNSWTDACAAKGYKAVEPDNYDVFTRFPKYLKAGQAEALMKLLSAHAHDKGLAIAQKNAAELLSDRASLGLDFAVAEECAEWNECGEFAEAYGDNVLVVEYTAKGMAKACTNWGGSLSIVRRDESVVPEGTGGYVHQTC
ncbi:endo alpha-1,4 polygalactosaminidase [Streptomyces sp. NPDC002092]